MPARITASPAGERRDDLHLAVAHRRREVVRFFSPRAAGADAARRCIEDDFVACFDAIAKVGLDLRQRDRRSEQDAALRGGAGDLADREIGFARQRRRRIETGAAAVGKQK